MASSYESARSNVTDTLVYRCCYVTAAAAAAAAAGDGDGGGVADRAIEPIISAGICWRLISFIEHRAGFGSIELRGCVRDRWWLLTVMYIYRMYVYRAVCADLPTAISDQ